MKKKLLALSFIVNGLANAGDVNKLQECGGVLLALAAVSIPTGILDYCTGYKNQKEVIKYLAPYVQEIKQGKDKKSVLERAAEDIRIVKRLPSYLAHHTNEYIASAQQWSLNSRVEYLDALYPKALCTLENQKQQKSFIQKLLSYFY